MRRIANFRRGIAVLSFLRKQESTFEAVAPCLRRGDSVGCAFPQQALAGQILVLCVAVSLFLAGRAAAEDYIDPAVIYATASSVNYQLEARYSCDGSGLTGDLHTNQISTGAQPPLPGEGTMWLAESAAGQWIQYQFDRIYSVSSMWVWNYNQNDPYRVARGIRTCRIEYSTDGDNWSTLGDTHLFAQADGTDAYAHNTQVDFRNLEAEFVRIIPLKNYGENSVGLSEVRFYAGNTVSFETSSSSAVEGSCTVELNVNIYNLPEGQSATVDYGVSGGSALLGEDYLFSSGTLSFDSAHTSRTISVEILDDGIDEQDETIEIELSNPVGTELGRIPAHTHTILDPRPAVGFASDYGASVENVSPVFVDVVLSRPAEVEVSVDYEVSDVTATFGVDYILNAGTLVLPAGATSGQIELTIIDDRIEEEQETFQITIVAAQGAKLGLTGHIHSISDDDIGRRFTNTIGMRFAEINPGAFLMGSEGYHFDEKPVHDVTITYPFYMAVYEATNAQYEQFDPDHATVDHRGFTHDPNEAAIFVSWHQADAFCRWLSAREGRSYRLPTEAEWEYACRAGTTGSYNTGESTDAANQQRSTTGPDPTDLTVGATGPNAWGLYDMHGNVEEWCMDWYGPYEPESQVDPVGRIDGDFKVTRGGSHSTPAWYLRSSNRMGASPEDRHWLMGFRVVMADLPDTQPLPVPPLERYRTNVSQTIPNDIMTGPDPNLPYFDGPNKYVFIPSELDGGPLFHQHNHVPGIIECPNGDLFIAFYSTIGERDRELSVAATRLRYGQQQWDQASVFWNTPDRNNHTPCLWSDHRAGRIYHFNGVADAYSWTPLAVTLRTSDDNGVTWTKARLIIPEHDIRHMPVESIFRTTAGSLVLPCDAVAGGSGGTAIWISDDNGVTWYDPGGTIAGIHAAAAEISDGRLLAFGRSNNIDGRMPKSVSSDMGQSWVKTASVFDPIGTAQRCLLLRLREGPLFFASFGSRGLFGAVSFDQGDTWPYSRLITDGSGNQVETLDGAKFTMSVNNAEPVGYLSVCQGRNGLIHLISSRQHYGFNLKWLVSDYVPAPGTCGDIDGDGLVSHTDLAQIAAGWLWTGLPGGTIPADLDGGGYVDLHDYALLAEGWQQACP